MNDVTPLPQLKGEQLLEQLVVDELRRRQRRSGMEILLAPFPPCPVCGQNVHEQHFTLGTADFDDRVLRNSPCGHRMKCSMKAVAQLVDQAQALADERENGMVREEQPAGPAKAATQATDCNEVAEALAAELHRRSVRLEELRPYRAATCLGCPAVQVDGEVIGLRGALGIVLGGSVPGGSADELALAYYRVWLERTGEGR